mmetsp:Transcript_52610/g.111735  ORF Transcript_52610/g.111735 Transcript_52610/m.111735 type:complete len:312 (+) Transcript_52610:152-1087(+)|eukprot:CAMPEP_0172547388 /NCGR_PEP_ID=MMETSP1067-20121228/16940_1 /TAXON_ID=265564 ORGANISM="Thalassiosira punctigera, Strain Tpunct2005C2" /NCGR_SAMPLE_ID=MMETSP1067 /ASSEMBLY_ACC=CAM_ASM_000444 /LENGTH=311 /DNA_ID=CAMNT_0013334469 /DNA_START=116 /DNA_END=1051 /DNA_ORIENTATION=-
MVSFTLPPFVLVSAYCVISQTSAFRSSPRLGHAAAISRTSSAASAVAPSPPKAEARTAPSVVVGKFDSYASTFESHLVDNLKYCAPREVARAASERIANDRDGEPYASALDAGCGTGLAGPPLRRLVSGPLVGADLSPKMAELAAELVVDDGPDPIVPDRMRRCSETARLALASDAPDRLYDGVFTADLLDLSHANFLEGYGHEVREMPSEPFDLIVAADVLCYFGAMDEVLEVFSERLAAGGDVIFTTETMNGGDYNWVETSSGRFAQNPEYVERMALQAGLAKVYQSAFTPRMESGEKVLGTLHIFTKL